MFQVTEFVLSLNLLSVYFISISISLNTAHYLTASVQNFNCVHMHT